MSWKDELAAYIAGHYAPDAAPAAVFAELTAPGLELSTKDILNYLSVTPTPAGGASISLALRVLGKTGTAAQQAMVDEIFAQLERNGEITLSVPAYRAALEAQMDALVTAQLMKASDKAALLAMAKPVGESIAAARGWPAGLELAHVAEVMARGE